MNEHFLKGFIKAANEAGIPEDQLAALMAQAPQGAPEQGAPEQGAPEQGAPEQGGEPSVEEIEHLISQLSPEEVQQLVSELEGAEGGAASQEHAPLPDIAQAIEQHLGSNPDVAGLMAQQGVEGQEKQSAINFIKSAAYVEGFLEQALNCGADIKTAVDLYEQAFTKTCALLKESGVRIPSGAVSAGESLGSQIPRAARDLASKIPGIRGYVKRTKIPTEATRGMSSKKINAQRAGVEKHNATVDSNYADLKAKAPYAGGLAAAGLGGSIVGAAATRKGKEDSKKDSKKEE